MNYMFFFFFWFILGDIKEIVGTFIRRDFSVKGIRCWSVMVFQVTGLFDLYM